MVTVLCTGNAETQVCLMTHATEIWLRLSLCQSQLLPTSQQLHSPPRTHTPSKPVSSRSQSRWQRAVDLPRVAVNKLNK